MKTTILKNFTTLEQAPKVKADAQEFKARYTDGDLLNAFRDTVDYWYCYTGEIVSCTVEAFPAGTDYIDENGEEPTHFYVKMTIDDEFSEIDKITFYTDMDLCIRSTTSFMGETRKMYSIERYILQK